jgi:exopolysaccharide biosynthesis polyprenyl glycosylphosphotransferase
VQETSLSSLTDTTTEPERAPARSYLRVRAHARQALGRALIVWIVAYVVCSPDLDAGAAVTIATIQALVYLPFLQWSSRLAREMPLVYGPALVALFGTASGFVAVSALSYWTDAVTLRDITLVACLTFIAITIWGTFLRRAATAPLRIAVIGGGQQVTNLLLEIEAHSAVDGFKVVGLTAESLATDQTDYPFPVVGLEDLEALVADVEPDVVVVAVEHGRPAVFARLLALASTERFSVLGLPEFYEVAFGRLPVHALTPAWFMSILHFYNRPYNQTAKRSFDIAASIILMIIVIPLVPIVALIVKRTPGPLLFRQQRLGEYGEIFEILKFRSMRTDAEADGAAVFAAEDDPRIIPGGKLIRRLRLDEIPQLWNVLRGEMSIVGPRPERPEFLEILSQEVPFWTQRNLLKPGITGWAQVLAGYTADSIGAEVKLSYDLWYLRHRSLTVDAIICLRTVGTVVTTSGAR